MLYVVVSMLFYIMAFVGLSIERNPFTAKNKDTMILSEYICA